VTEMNPSAMDRVQHVVDGAVDWHGFVEAIEQAYRDGFEAAQRERTEEIVALLLRSWVPGKSAVELIRSKFSPTTRERTLEISSWLDDPSPDGLHTWRGYLKRWADVEAKHAAALRADAGTQAEAEARWYDGRASGLRAVLNVFESKFSPTTKEGGDET